MISSSFNILGKGTEAQVAPDEKNACTKNLIIASVKASGHQAGNLPENVKDGNLTTHWTNKNSTSWIQADIGPEKVVCSLSISWYKGNQRTYNFTISISDNGTSFKNLLPKKMSGKTIGLENYTFPESQGRYIRIATSENSERKPYSAINEIKIYGHDTNTSNESNTSKKLAAILNATESLANATEALKNATQNIKGITDPCKSATQTTPSSIAIDSKKIFITPQDVLLNVLVYDKNNCLINKQVNIKVRYLGNGDQANTNIHNIAKLASASANLSQQNNDPINEMPLIYDQTAPSTFFSKSGVPIDNEGLYLVRASIPGQKELDYSLTFINGVRLDHTRFAYSMIFGIVAFIVLLSLSLLATKFVIFDKYSKEARFFFISAIVFSSLAALYFVSEELGVGAPVGLIKRPLINSTSITDLIPGSSGQQWVLNIGGVPENSYKFGLQIPIYVFVFGIIGGYIRYLYNTTQSQPDIRTKEYIRLFNWNNIPGSDEGWLKNFLQKEHNLEWITDKLNFTRDDKTKTLSLKDDKNNSLSITLDDDTATLRVMKNDKEEKNKRFIVRKENDNKIVYSEEYGKSNIFYSSLRDIALILLAPLLAAAVWFLIIQNGIDPTKGIYVLAVVSFAVGLATDNVVQALVNFVNTSMRPRGTQTSTVSEQQ